MASLEQLPLEILGLIFEYVDPLDLLALTQISRYLRDVLMERSTWLNAVKGSSKTNHTFISPSTLEHMSLQDLQYIATSPFRMITLLQAGKTDVEASSIEPTFSITLPSVSNVKDIYLVPGGIYLLTLTLSSLEVWELCPYHVAYSNILGKPLASDVVCGPGYGCGDIVCVSAQGSSFRIAVTYSVPPGDYHFLGQQIAIYEFDSNLQPMLRRIGAQMILDNSMFELDTCCSCLRGDFFGCCFGDKILLWNFIADTYIYWIVPDIRQIYVKVVIHDEHFILIGLTTLYAWKIPTLRPRNPNPSRQLRGDFTDLVIHSEGVCPPPYFLHSQFEISGNFVQPTSVDNWYLGTSHFDCCGTTYSSYENIPTTGDVKHCVKIKRYRFSPSIFPAEGSVFHQADIDITQILKFGFVNMDPKRFCQGYFVRSSRGAKVTAFATPIAFPKTSDSSTPVVNPAKVVILNEDVFRQSFDPASGRLAYIREGQRNVVVGQYLGGPSHPKT